MPVVHIGILNIGQITCRRNADRLVTYAFVIIVDNSTLTEWKKKKISKRVADDSFVHCYCFHCNHSNTHSNSFRPLRNEEKLFDKYIPANDMMALAQFPFPRSKTLPLILYLNNGFVGCPILRRIYCVWLKWICTTLRGPRGWLRFSWNSFLGLKGLPQPLGQFGHIDFSTRFTSTWMKRACPEWFWLKNGFPEAVILFDNSLECDFVFGHQFFILETSRFYNELMSLLSSTRD